MQKFAIILVALTLTSCIEKKIIKMQPSDFCDAWGYVPILEDSKMSEFEKEHTELNNATYDYYCAPSPLTLSNLSAPRFI
jgi:hypothetical protein